MEYILIFSVVLIWFIMRFTIRYSNFSILDITFTKEEAESQEVKNLLTNERRDQLILLVVTAIIIYIGNFKRFESWSDVLSIVVLFLYLIVAYILVVRLQRDLISLKVEKGWVHERSVKAADLSSTREIGKSAPGSLILWIIWAFSFVPFINNIRTQETVGSYILYLLISLSFLVIPLTYKKAVETRVRVISINSQENLSYRRRVEWISAMSYIAMAISSTLLYVGLMLGFQSGYGSNLFVFGSLILFTLILVITLLWSSNELKKAEEDYFEEPPYYIKESEARYKYGFYFNHEDSRVFVPKRLGGLGVTLNIAHPIGKILALATVALVVSALGMVIILSISDIEYNISQDTFTIDVPMYGQEIHRDEISSISLNDEDLNGMRTNGYGGSYKSYGHFTVDHYGNVMLYMYSNDKEYIVLELKDKVPKYIIFNGENSLITEQLYNELLEWQP